MCENGACPGNAHIRGAGKMNDDIKRLLVETYDRHAADREQSPVAEWKRAERASFSHLLHEEGKRLLLEVGSGTGKDSEYFLQSGLDPVVADISPEMVRLCRGKGLASLLVDCYALSFQEESFEAVWSMNALLHVPSGSLPGVLGEIHAVMQPGGLFYLGLWGGDGFEGVWEGDCYTPKRFFSFRTDGEIDQIVHEWFEPVFFRALDPGGGNAHFQSTMWRKPQN